MGDLSSFVLSNWYLFVALIVVLVLLFVNLGRGRLLGFGEVRPVEAVGMINHEGAVPLDIRTDDEFCSGHIVGALHIPYALLEGRLSELESYRDRPLLVYCESGRQAAHACATLHRAGFGSLYKLTGGLMAWRGAELPLERSPGS